MIGAVGFQHFTIGHWLIMWLDTFNNCIEQVISTFGYPFSLEHHWSDFCFESLRRFGLKFRLSKALSPNQRHVWTFLEANKKSKPSNIFPTKNCREVFADHVIFEKPQKNWGIKDLTTLIWHFGWLNENKHLCRSPNFCGRSLDIAQQL